jgi:hypothetical protein
LAEKERTFIKERRALIPLDEAIAIKSAEIDIVIKRKNRRLGTS